MVSLVAAKCPHCGASLKIDVARELTTCPYCHTTSFIKTRARPLTEEIALRHRAVIDTTKSANGWIALIFAAVLCAGGAAAFLVLRPQLAAPSLPRAPSLPLAPPISGAPVHSAPDAVMVPLPASAPPVETVSPAVEVAPTSRVKPSQVRLGSLTVTGRLGQSVVQRLLRQRFDRVRLCYEQALARLPKLQGRISLRLVIDRDGRVPSISSFGSDMGDSDMVGCVVASFAGLVFPAPEGGIVTVLAPLHFSS
jgi:DNA-directed RNA polymerase subunit RPC12/RpoP